MSDDQARQGNVEHRPELQQGSDALRECDAARRRMQDDIVRATGHLDDAHRALKDWLRHRPDRQS